MGTQKVNTGGGAAMLDRQMKRTGHNPYNITASNLPGSYVDGIGLVGKTIQNKKEIILK